MSDTEPFGAFIRQRRLGLGIGLREMAAKVSISPTYLSKVERDEFDPPSEDKVRKIATVLGCDEEELIARAGRVPADLPEIIKRQPIAMAALLRTSQDLSADQINALIQAAQKAKKGST